MSNTDSADAETKEVEFARSERDWRRLRQRDFAQRFTVRWIAVATGIAVMLLMAGILVWHLFGEPLVPLHNRFSWVVIVVPATSLTVIATALFVAAFRRSEDKTAESEGMDGGEWESARIGGMMAGGGGGSGSGGGLFGNG